VRRLGLAASAAILVVLGALVLHGGHAARRPTARPTARPPAALMLSSPAGPAITIGAHPVGLSIEYPLLVRDLGAGGCPPPELVAAITALGSPVLRIGGDSQDKLAPAGSAPAGDLSVLPAHFWSQLGCLERETRIPVVVGLNVAWGRRTWAAAMAAGARSAVPRSRLSFELGNEPDIYGDPVPWWNGRALTTERMPWRTYLARVRALAAVLGPRTSLEGPDFASGRWVARVPALARTLHLAKLDAHFYPLDGCHDPGAATTALLSRQIQSKLDERVRLARDARAAGLPAVISEANSISCGGQPGASDEPAAAVWALRMILTALRDGFVSVRFHSSGGSYDPFVVHDGAVATRPLYAGLREAAALLTPGAKLRPIPDASSLDGVEITARDGAQTFVLSDYGSAAAWVALHATAPVRVLRVAAEAPALSSATVAAAAGVVRVKLAPNSVDAVTLAPSA
jgi:hypothetical protein